MSYANILLYNATTPGYNDVKEGDKSINASNPDNNRHIEQLFNDE